MTSRPVGQEGHCFLVGSNPVQVQDFDDFGFRFRFTSINYKGCGSSSLKGSG